MEAFGRIDISADVDPGESLRLARASIPLPTSGMLLKWFQPEDFLKAHGEAAAYAHLKKSFQGEIIPFCYGAYEMDERGGIGILLENVYGNALEQCLGMNPRPEESRQLFKTCFHGLERLHLAGLAHGDVLGENILIVNDDCVLIDFENLK